jgi:hypothetical protein
MTTRSERFFNITDRTYTSKEIDELETIRRTFIIADPPKDLQKLYEVNRIADLLGIRAEMYDSPEFQHVVEEMRQKNGDKNCFKIPRNKQNPNFDQLLKHLDSIRKENKLLCLRRFVEFLEDIGVHTRVVMSSNELRRLEDTKITTDIDGLRQLERWTEVQTEHWDVRFCRTYSEALSYLYNHYVLYPPPKEDKDKK